MKKCCDMKGFLTFSVLKMVGCKEMSGEDIREEIKKRRGTKPSSGTIYPVLKSLKQSGFIEESNKEGKVKKYKLTKKGEKELDVAIKKFCEMFHDMKDDFGKFCR